MSIQVYRPKTREEWLGLKYGRLTILGLTEVANKDGTRRRVFECVCDCGKKIIAPKSRLTSGNTQSCGCLRAEMVAKKNLKHGHSPKRNRSPEYNSWCAMKGRCLDPKNKKYSTYGGRGISISEMWIASFECFLSDMGARPEGHTLDRIDSNGNYEANNCRWSSSKVQCQNRRSTRLNADQARSIRADTRSTSIICAEYGVSRNTIWGIKTGRIWSNVD